MQNILGQRYIQDTKLLKLDALASDAELVNLGMFENRERALKTFKGLMAICDGLFKTLKEKREAVESMSLANNSIDDVVQVETVAITFPQLKNLDMSGNQIASMQGLDRWKGKFRELETLYMVGNPIEQTDPNYQAVLLDWFPKLNNINGNELRTPEQIAARAAAQMPKAIPQHGPDIRDVGGVGEQFLIEFLTGYDNDRAGLLSRFYDDASQFSLAVDTASVRDPNAPAPLPWAPYIKFSRNLTKINSLNARIQRLFKGANVIHDLWNGLPFTRHPSIKDTVNKYIVDCHPLPGLADLSGMSPIGVDGLIMSIHGEFEECDQQSQQVGMRSFSRTFVLGPGQPGKSAVRVVSDILSLRAYSPLPDVFALAAQNAPQPQPNPTTSQDQHQAMIAELSKQTGMTPQYSELCLVEVGWDFAKGLAIFAEKKVSFSYTHQTHPRSNSCFSDLNRRRNYLQMHSLHRNKELWL